MKLGEVCNLILGQSPSSDSYNTDGVGLPFYQGNADFGEDHPTPRVWCNEPKKVALPGDILISVRAPIGAINVADEKCCIGRGVAAIEPYCKIVSRDFLKQQLLAKRAMLESRGTGSTFKAVGKRALLDFPIRVYPLPEQAHIEQQFKQVLSSISACRHYLTLLDALVKSRFAEMFGDPYDSERWPMMPLGALYNVKSSKRIYAREQAKEGVPFYRLADIGNLIDGKRADSGSFISDERFDDLANSGYVPIAGDILVTARGTLGKCYVIRASDRFYFQDGMITWLSQTEASPMSDYLIQIFRNNEFISQLNDSCSGTTVKYLSISDLAKVRIPMPPIELQQQLIGFVQEVDKSKSIARKQIEKLQLLYDSLAQEYFGD